MVLSGNDIKRYMATGKLVIEPVEEVQFQQNGIDLILESVSPDNQYFQPCKFYLGATREVLQLPDDLMGFVNLRSSWARRGIMIPPTIVDAGFKGNLTIEMVPFSKIEVPVGQRFLHLVLARLTGPADSYSGKYQGQTGITKAMPDWVK